MNFINISKVKIGIYLEFFWFWLFNMYKIYLLIYMTKKTDSLIFRYGTQTLWNNTNFLFKTSVTTSFFFKFLYFELQKTYFELLSIEQKNYNVVYAFVFCFFFKDALLALKTNYAVFFFKIFSYYKYWFIFKILYVSFYFLKINFLAIFNINLLLHLICTNIVLWCKSEFYYLREVECLDILFLKIEQLRLESNLSLFFFRNFTLKLQNIFNFPLYFDFIQMFNTNKSTIPFKLTTVEYLLYLSCKLRMSCIFARFLAKSLEIGSNHRKVLWSIANSVKFLRRNLCLFKGIRIYITGKLNGKMRRKTYSFKCGSVALQRIHRNLDYFKATSFTKFGTISVKVWLFFN